MLVVLSLIFINLVLVVFTSGYTIFTIIMYCLYLVFGFILAAEHKQMAKVFKLLKEKDYYFYNNHEYVLLMREMPYPQIKSTIIGSSIIHMGISLFLLNSYVLTLMISILLYVRLKNAIENERVYSE